MCYRTLALSGFIALLLTACAPIGVGSSAPSSQPNREAAAVSLLPMTPMLLAGSAPPDGALLLPPLAPAPPGINPLTGLPLGDAPSRPLVVKVSNAPPLVRPQAGIAAADLVFEHYTEGGLTRFSAVFYSALPERVGSIRSARLLDDELTTMFSARLVYSGASEGVDAILNRAAFAPRLFKGVLYEPPYFWRDEAIDPPHNLFANLRAIAALPDSTAVPVGAVNASTLAGLTFSPEVPPGGPAQVVTVRYIASVVRWDYDPALGQYRRTSDGLPHTDANTGEQVTADNVVVLFADHTTTDIVESVWQEVTSYSIAIDLSTYGTVLLARDGRWLRGQWARPADGGMMRLLTPGGQPLALRPGRTWIQVLPLPVQQNLAIEGVRIE